MTSSPAPALATGVRAAARALVRTWPRRAVPAVLALTGMLTEDAQGWVGVLAGLTVLPQVGQAHRDGPGGSRLPNHSKTASS